MSRTSIFFLGTGRFDACNNFEPPVLGGLASRATGDIPVFEGSVHGVLDSPLGELREATDGLIGALRGAADRLLDALSKLPGGPVMDGPLNPEGHLDPGINIRADAARDSEFWEVAGA